MHHWGKIRLYPFSVRRGVLKLPFPECPKPGWLWLQPELSQLRNGLYCEAHCALCVGPRCPCHKAL